MAKQNKIKLYAEALAQIIIEKKAEGPERSRRTVENFIRILIGAGLEKKAGEILDLAQDLLLKKQGKKKIIIESARTLNSHNKNILSKIAKGGDVVINKINPDLIAGVKIIIDGEKQFDSSLKSKLQNIWK